MKRKLLFYFLLSILFLANNSLAQCDAKAGSDTLVCKGSAVVIGGISTGDAPISYTWTPATGLNNPSSANPTASPTTTTTYTLSITDGSGCTSTDQVKVTVVNLPDATFTFSPNNVCAYQNIVFNANASGSNYTYSWNFGNPASPNNTATGKNPIHKFVSYAASDVTYNVSLTVTNTTTGCMFTTTNPVTIKSLPHAGLIDPVTSFKNCDGTNFTLNVYDNTPFNGINYQIFWGDGVSQNIGSSAPTGGLTHTYTTVGIFDLYYVVKAPNGCLDTAKYIVSNITNPAIGAANPGNTTGCSPLSLCIPLTNYTGNHNSTIYYIDYGDNSKIDTITHDNLPNQVCHLYNETSCGKPLNAYTFTIKAINQCDISIATITPIRIFNPPTPDFSMPSTACVNSTVPFTNNTTEGHNTSCAVTTLYKWDFGDGSAIVTTPSKTNPTHVYTSPGTYTITLTAQNSCGGTPLSKTICIEAAPTVNYVLAPDNACVPFASVVDNQSDTTNSCHIGVNWQMINYVSMCSSSQNWSYSGGTNGASWEPNFNIQAAGKYTFRLTLTNTCGSFYSDKTIIANDKPKASIPSVGPLCAGEKQNYSASVNDCGETITTYNWTFTSGSPATSTAVSPLNIAYGTAGNYPVKLIVKNSCGSTNATQTIQVNEPPIANAGQNVNFCSGSSASIGSAPVAGVSYTWTPSTNLATPNNATTSANPTNLGTTPLVIAYTVKAYTSATCFATDNVNVTVNPIPEITVTGNDICAGQTASLSATSTDASAVISWTANATLSCTNCSTPSANPTVQTTYYASAVNQYSCPNSKSVTIKVNPLPTVNAGIDIVSCDQPIPFTMTGSPAGGTWSGSPNITAAGVFTPNGNEVVNVTYSYTNPVTNCSNSDVAKVTIQSAAVPTFNATPAVCENAGVVNLNTAFNPNPTGGTWSGTNVSGINFDPQAAGVGTHTVKYSYGNGACLVVTNLSIKVNPKPSFTVTGATICAGDSAQLTISGNGTDTYTWTPATGLACSTCDQTKASPAATTNYTVKAKNTFTCETTKGVTVTVKDLPIVNAGIDFTACDQPIPFTVPGTPSGGTWSGSTNITSTGVFTPNGNEISTLTYTYTDPVTNCPNSDNVKITVQAATVPTFNATPAVCENAGVVNLNTAFNPNPTGGTWSGTNVSGINFDPQAAGAGSKTVSYSYGSGTCLVKTNLTITVNPKPTITVNNDVICFGDSATLIASGAGVGGSYTWTPTTGLACATCAQTKASPASTKTYQVKGTNQYTCSSTANSTVTVNLLPIISIGNDTTLCNTPQSVTLQGLPSGGTWSGANINAAGIFTPTVTGAFTVTYTYSNGGTSCSNADSLVITVIDPVDAKAGIDQDICIQNSTVQLTGLPNGGIWSGSPAITNTGIFSVATDGTYDLIYSYGIGNCLTKDTMKYVVYPLPIVNAGSDVAYCVSDAKVNFTGTPANGTWSGVGITNANNGEFTPSTAGVGTHKIMYTYQNPTTTCINKDSLDAKINPLPIVDFQVDSIVCVGANTAFVNQSTLIAQSYWDFGDNSTSTSQDPTHQYTASGTYTVKLIITSPSGCKDSIAKQIDVYTPPSLNFSLTPDSLCGPLTASFTNTSTGQGVTYLWDFGNGTTSSTYSPNAVTYPASLYTDTSYYISLTATNLCGTFTQIDSVKVMPKPKAVFGTDYAAFCSPWKPNIANTSYGLPDFYSWNFGNGTTSNTSSSLFQLPIYTTGAADTTYTITLAVSNECGVDTSSYTITVMPNTVDAFFNTNIASGCAPLTVNFTQYTLGGTNYHWDFGDGNASSQYSPAHTFAQGGTYQVTLFANNGCSYDTATATVTVLPQPVLNFTFLPDSACVLKNYQFTNTTVLPLGNISWDFGDGTTSTLSNPTHAFTAGGNFNVTMTGTSNNGCPGAVTKVVHVNTPPIAKFAVTPIDGCMPLKVKFTNQSTGYAYSYWDFDDGNFSTISSPTHTYTAAGNYLAKLIVQSVNGCSDTIAHYINVNPIPTANFTYLPTGTICGPNMNIAYTNTSTGAVGYQWSFGDGNTSTVTSPINHYVNAGVFTVRLIASNQFGCSDTAIQQIQIHQTPVANFSLISPKGCQNKASHFLSSSLDADSVVWDFGDGTKDYGNSVYHTYSDTGVFVVSIVAYGSGGCNTSFTAPIPIEIYSSPTADFTYETNNEVVQNATIVFTNESSNYSSSHWLFGDGNTSDEKDPKHDYHHHNEYTTSLIVTNTNGCKDTMTVLIHNDLLQGLFVPNAVYPGSDSYEVSHFLPKGIGLKEYKLEIYDDWGNLIWETSALDEFLRPAEGWDGTYRGVPVQQDAYVWKISARFLDGSVWEGKDYSKRTFKRSGTVTVIR